MRLHAELIVELTAILGVTADEILGLQSSGLARLRARARGRDLMRRIDQIDALPRRERDTLMQMIDAQIAKAMRRRLSKSKD